MSPGGGPSSARGSTRCCSSSMAVTIAAEPRLLHAVPGRVRVHVPALAGYGARSVEAQVRRALGVRDVDANPLTGRVLVQVDAHRTDIDDLLAAITAVELPALPAADTPSHPLDPAPLIQSVARTVGAILGLGLVTVRRVARVPVVSPGRA